MAADDPRKPLVERINARLRANPIVAVAIVIGSIVVGIASFTNAASGLIARFSPKQESPASARAALGQLDLPFTSEAFVSSADAGDLAAVKLFVSAGMDPSASAANGSTALASAAFHGRGPVATFLLDAGARIVDDGGDRSALYSAVAGTHNDMVRLLLERKPDRAAIDAAFVLATRRKLGVPVRNVEAMRLLAAAGADVRKLAPKAFTNVWFNASDDDAAEVVRTLLDLGAVLADLDGTDGETTTMTPLMETAALDFPETADVLLAHGARLDTRYRHPDYDDDGATALMLAARSGSPVIVQALLAKGADAAAKDRRGSRALDYAKRGGGRATTPAIVRSLQQSRAAR